MTKPSIKWFIASAVVSTLTAACHRSPTPTARIASRSNVRDLSAAAANAVDTRPVLGGDFADPFVLRANGAYYAFATNANGKNVHAARSTDLATWSEIPDPLPTLPSWAKANEGLTWAPSVLQRDNGFVLYYTARSKTSDLQCIGRATSTSPEGPYVDDSTEPFICQVTAPQAFCGSIDPSPFVDDDGEPYLVWKSDENAAPCHGASRLWSQRLAHDGRTLLGTATELLRRDRAWEAPLIEGPSMVKAAGNYFLFYSANWWESANYSVGYAVCRGPLGPCEKRTLDRPLAASSGETLGPGGQEFVTDEKGQMWMTYHAWSNPTVGYEKGGARSLHMTPVSFTNGVPTLGTAPATPEVATGADPSNVNKT
ncbi:MAG: glycoside hydrolase family 43 protein [Polyangiaceae bacterium]|nr:glycoside hydrolase family 43 protein [Polyangiaceae bacterium]